LPDSVRPFAEGPRETQSLRVAVYDVPPYGYVDSDGSISGVSVDLWRRVAEQMEWPFRLIPISDMESMIGGLEQGRFDAAIGAITITPERAARVDFSHPAHRSGGRDRLAKGNGPDLCTHVIRDGRLRTHPFDLGDAWTRRSTIHIAMPIKSTLSHMTIARLWVLA